MPQIQSALKLAAALALGAAIVPARDEEPGEIRCTRFVMVDADGKETVVIEEREGGTCLSILHDGKPTALLMSAHGSGAGLVLYGPKMTPRASLSYVGDKSSSVDLYDKAGSPRSSLRWSALSGEELVMQDLLGLESLVLPQR